MRAGQLEVLVCPTLIAGLDAALRKPRWQRWLPDADEVANYVTAVVRWSTNYSDPLDVNPSACRDPNDAYLLALGVASGADAIVSGDKDLTVLRGHRPPVLTPRRAVELLDALD